MRLGLAAWEASFLDATELLDELGGDSAWRAKTHAVEVNPRDRESYAVIRVFGRPARQLEALNRYAVWEPEDPNWLLDKLELLAHELKDEAAANDVLEEIRTGSWDARFGNVAGKAILRLRERDDDSRGAGRELSPF